MARIFSKALIKMAYNSKIIRHAVFKKPFTSHRKPLGGQAAHLTYSSYPAVALEPEFSKKKQLLNEKPTLISSWSVWKKLTFSGSYNCRFDAGRPSMPSLQPFSSKTCHFLRQQNPKPAWHKSWHPA